MPCITWNNELSLGNSFFDNDHLRLLDLVNALHDALIRDEGRDLILKAFDELIDFTRIHFKYEEEEMLRRDFPQYFVHKAEHDHLLDQIAVLENKYNAGTITLAVQVSLFLRDWLVNHILTLDSEFAAAIAAQQAA